MKITLLSVVFALSIRSASSQLTPWDHQNFDFGWEPYDPTITRCSRINISWNRRPTATPPATGPFIITALFPSFQPITIATVTPNAYNWTVNLPTGGPYIMTMTDANQLTGGNSIALTVQDAQPGTSPCANAARTANSLELTTSGSGAQCSTLVVTATGGTAPYRMQIMAAQRPPKTTTWTTSTMSYTIDMQASEQYFVLVTDSTGLSGVNGPHFVANGDSGCYNVATTVSSGLRPTTLSYNPSSTESFSRSTSSPNSSSRVIQNTETTTIVSTVTGADGTKVTITLAPGASTTITDTNQAISEPPSSVAPIVGGAIGGAALLLILLMFFLWYRRRRAQDRLARNQELYKRRRLSDPLQPIPIDATYISPFPVPTPGHDTAPLMGHLSSTYSGSGFTGSAYTPVPTNTVTSGQDPATPPPWVISAGSSTVGYNNHGPSPESPPPHARTTSSGEGIPRGAMASQTHGGRQSQKASFMPAEPPTVAPPPYSQGG